MSAALINDRDPNAMLYRVSRVVLFADVVDSVRHIEDNEEETIRRWLTIVDETQRRLLDSGDGRLVKRLGDGLLAEFDEASAASRAAMHLQETLAAQNVSLDPKNQIQLRIGLASGEILRTADDDLYGQHVNMAARLAAAVRPGQIVASASVRDMLASDPETDFEDIGDLHLKNVSRPTRAFILRTKGASPNVTPKIPAHDLLPTIAVLPISVHTDMDGADIWSDLLTENLIAALSRSSEVDVISRLSTTGYRSISPNINELRTALNADFILSGMCHEHVGKTDLNIELAESRTGLVIWSHHLECDAVDILQRNSMFYDLANQVHSALLKREMNRALSEPLPTLEGYALLFGAIALMNRLSRHDFEFAGELLQALIERIPRAPSSLAWMARWHVLKVQQGWADDRMLEARLALDYTERALDIDPENTAALVAEGFVRNNLIHDLNEAEALFNAALASTPSDAMARSLRGVLYTFRGEGPEAVRDTERALHLAPLDPNRFFFQAMAAGASLANNDPARAVALAESSLRLNRLHTSTLRIKAVGEWRLGESDKARATIEKLLVKQPGFSISWWQKSSPAADYPMGTDFVQSLRELGVPD